MWIFAQLLTQLTGKPRYKPDIQWSNLFIYNLFRVYESVLWRRAGIKAEMSMHVWNDEKGKHVLYKCHSWESVFVFFEQYTRDLFNRKIQIPIKITIPIFTTSQGINFPASPYLFAIAFDTDLVEVDGSGDITQAYTVTGSNPYFNLSAGIQTAGTCTGVTYNAVSMSTIDSGNSGQGAGTETNYLFGLNAPTTGTNNIIASFSLQIHVTFIYAASYSGVAQSAQPEAHGTFQSGAATSFSKAVTTITDNAWLVGAQRLQSTPTAGANTTLRPSGTNLSMIDSNAAQTPPGSFSLTVTQVSGYGMIFVTSIAPFGAAVVTSRISLLTLLGVG